MQEVHIHARATLIATVTARALLGAGAKVKAAANPTIACTTRIQIQEVHIHAQATLIAKETALALMQTCAKVQADASGNMSELVPYHCNAFKSFNLLRPLGIDHGPARCRHRPRCGTSLLKLFMSKEMSPLLS